MKNESESKKSSMLLLLLASNHPNEVESSNSSRPMFSLSDYKPTGETIFSGSLKNCKIVRDRMKKELYTLKTIPKYTLLSIQATRRKIQKTIELDHPNLLKIHFFLEDPSNFYIFYQHIPGNDLLFEIITEDGLSDEKCLNYFYKTSEVVDLLHSSHLVLKHLSLENIYFDSDHNLKLAIEFEDKEITKDYLPPEKGRASYKSDIWCLGLMFYEMVHGYFPEDLSELNPDLPIFVYDLISKLLNKNPEKRISSRRLIIHSYFNKKLEQSVIIDRIERRINRSMKKKKIPRSTQSTYYSANISISDTFCSI